MVRRAVLIAASAVILLVHGEVVPLDMESTMVAADTPAPTPELVCSKSDSDEPLRNTDEDLTYVIAFYGSEGTPFVESDGDIVWPYAIDKCTAIAPISADNLYGKFTCSEDDTEITFTKYQDKDCETMVEEETYSSLPTPLGFNCAGNKGESYVAIDFTAADDSCGAQQHTYGTVTVCHGSRIPPEYVNNGYSYLYCDADGSKQEFFDIGTGQCWEQGTYCSDLVIENTCGLLFTSSAGTNIYGKTVECESAEKDESRADSSDERSSSMSPESDESSDDESSDEMNSSMSPDSPTQSPNSSNVDELNYRLSFYFGFVCALCVICF